MLRRIFRLPVFLIILAPIGLFAPVWLMRRALFWGTPVLQFIPWRLYAWEVLLAGHLPLWNPLSGMGAPLIGNYQSGFFYPPNWIYFILAALGGAPVLAWGQSLLVTFHLILAGLGMARLVRWLGLDEFSQTISGLAFCLSGYLIARAGFLSINAAVSWMPWIMLAVGKMAIEAPQKKPGLLPAHRLIFLVSILIALQLLSGHAQTSWYTLILAFLWGSFWVLFPAVTKNTRGPDDSAANRRWHDRLSCLGQIWFYLGISTLLAAALAAIQLLPTAEYLLQSQRSSAVDYEYGMTYSFWPWRLLTLLAPDIFGNPANGNYWGYANYWEDAIYIGLLPLLLAVNASWSGARDLFSLVKKRNRLLITQTPFILFLVSVILLSFILALGKNTPIFTWLYYHVPTFAMFDAPTRFTLWAEFCLAVLAGIGAQLWQRPTGRSLYWTRLGVAGAVAVGLGAALASFLFKDIKPTFIQSTALAGMWAAGAGILSLISPRGVGDQQATSRVMDFLGNHWAWLVCLFIIADLWLADRGLNPGIDASVFKQQNSINADLPASLRDGRIYLPGPDEKYLKFSRFFRFASFQPLNGSQDWVNLRRTILPDLNLLDRIPSANNFDPLIPSRYARWMEALNNAEPPSIELMLNLMGVKIVERMDETQPLGIKLTPRLSFPRIRWVACARSAQDEEDAWSQVLGMGWNPANEVILEDATFPEQAACSDTSTPALQIITDDVNRLIIRYQAEKDGYLVVADTWYPGWVGKLDKKTVPILHANYLFRAIVLPAGEHEVTMVYQPISFYAGVVITCLTLIAFITYAVKSRHRLHGIDFGKR
jgi:hypothetical protein